MTTTSSKRGGARPGAGRPAQGTGRKQPVTIMLTPEGVAAREALRQHGIDVNAMLDAFLRRNVSPFGDSE